MPSLSPKFLLLLVLSATATTISNAATVKFNDWSKPCTSGVCQYETGDGKKTAYAALTISGATTSIADITGAGGWEILNCDPKWAKGSQNIRLVCTGENCNHLFDGGAEGSVVRLPESCGAGPFARVSKSWVPKDQSVPKRLLRKRQAGQQVQALRLDFNFAEVDPAKGKINIAISATNVKGKNLVSTSNAAGRNTRSRGRKRHLERRQFGDFFSGVGDFFSDAGDAVADFAGDAVEGARNVGGQIGDFVSDGASAVGDFAGDAFEDAREFAGNVGEQIGDAVSDGADAVGEFVGDAVDGARDVAENVGDAIQDGAEAVGDAVGELNEVDTSDSIELPPIQFSRQINLVDEQLNCENVGGVEGLGIGAGLKVDVDAQVQARIVFGYAIAGTLVPPRLTDFSVSANANGDASATFTIKANAQGDFSTGNIPLFSSGLPGLSLPGIITVGPSFSINANLGAEIGINADIVASAAYTFPNVQLVFPPEQGQSVANIQPADAPLKLDLDPTVTVNGNANAHLIPRLDLGIDVFGGIAKATVFLELDGAAVLSLEAQGQASVGNQEEASASFSGCVGLDATVDVKAGAEGAIEPFFSRNVEFNIFSTTFDVFENCFGNAQKKRAVRRRRSAIAKRALSCPSANAGETLAPVV